SRACRYLLLFFSNHSLPLSFPREFKKEKILSVQLQYFQRIHVFYLRPSAAWVARKPKMLFTYESYIYSTTSSSPIPREAFTSTRASLIPARLSSSIRSFLLLK